MIRSVENLEIQVFLMTLFAKIRFQHELFEADSGFNEIHGIAT